MRFDLLKGIGSDPRNLQEVFDSLVGAAFDDSIGKHFPDAGETHQVVPSGVIGIDFFVAFEVSIVERQLCFPVFITLLSTLIGKAFPVGLSPDSEATAGGSELQISKVFLIFGLRAAVVGGSGHPDGTGESF